ncbi:hypothetical protein GXW82_05530 [Streptacidiphilus sp. 4-A2]|nr:hypothetical protein [Streptacidiphilus sp. 4-A2]
MPGGGHRPVAVPGPGLDPHLGDQGGQRLLDGSGRGGPLGERGDPQPGLVDPVGVQVDQGLTAQQGGGGVRPGDPQRGAQGLSAAAGRPRMDWTVASRPRASTLVRSSSGSPVRVASATARPASAAAPVVRPPSSSLTAAQKCSRAWSPRSPASAKPPAIRVALSSRAWPAVSSRASRARTRLPASGVSARTRSAARRASSWRPASAAWAAAASSRRCRSPACAAGVRAAASTASS